MGVAYRVPKSKITAFAEASALEGVSQSISNYCHRTQHPRVLLHVGSVVIGQAPCQPPTRRDAAPVTRWPVVETFVHNFRTMLSPKPCTPRKGFQPSLFLDGRSRCAFRRYGVNSLLTFHPAPDIPRVGWNRKAPVTPRSQPAEFCESVGAARRYVKNLKLLCLTRMDGETYGAFHHLQSLLFAIL